MTTPTHTEPRRRLAPEEFRDVIGHFASGVTVITALHQGEPFGTTASAVSSLSLEPPMLLVCLNKQSETGRALAACGHFAVNILGAGQADLADRFARKGGNKFDGVATTPGQWGEPLIEEAIAALECAVTEKVTAATHYVFFAEVVSATARGGAPLTYFKGQFAGLSWESRPS